MAILRDTNIADVFSDIDKSEDLAEKLFFASGYYCGLSYDWIRKSDRMRR